MDRNFKWRALVVAAALVMGLVYLYPSLADSLPTWWTKIMPTNKLQLGLDLQGGMHLDLRVELEKAVVGAMERNVDELKKLLLEKRIRVARVAKTDDDKIELLLTNPEDMDSLNKLLNDDFRNLATLDTTEEEDRVRILLGFTPEEVKRIKDSAFRQALETIRNRIDPQGVSEPDIRSQGEDRIILQLPGEKDPERAKALIRKTAFLEFKLVEEGTSPEAALENGAPDGTQILYGVETDQQTGRSVKGRPYLVKERPLMTGEYVTDAKVAFNNMNQPYVSLSFDSKGARLFEDITGQYVRRQLAVVLDGVVYTAPVIQERISGGRAQISGTFTLEEARDIAVVLRAGALPAPVTVQEERTVGPSLGHESIVQGFKSIVAGMVLVLIFMAFYYRLSGLIADTALCFNLILIIAAMAAFKATLTLPGIAGIILTIGMSVDANVLIFERIREEIRLGKTPRAAVDGGFSKALWTILDANVTTLIAAIVLYSFGTGPVRGFAVTLSVGIVASLFTAIFVSRLIFDYLLVNRKMKAVSV